jgi:uncharacterized protein YwgA
MGVDVGAQDGMKVRDILLVLIARGQGRVEFGRTSLQKVAYFVARAMGRDLGHRPHYYGPYASSIEQEVQTLVLSGLVEEKARSLGFANQFGFEAKQYEYSLTEAGQTRVGELTSRHKEETSTIDGVIDSLLEHTKRLDQGVLSAAAKVDFIASHRKEAVTVEDVKLAANDLGWSLTDTQVESVFDLLSKLGFARAQRG